MFDRPIIFSAPMVQALLAGRKTQTRRVIKPRSWNADGDKVNIDLAPTAKYMQGGDGRFYYQFDHPQGGPLTAHLATFNVGDRLWVREAWTSTADHVFSVFQARITGRGCIIYRADENPEYPNAKFWPSIHMPREFSRLTLTVTDVRVQRLQDISKADAIAEGLRWRPALNAWTAGGDDWPTFSDPRRAFAGLWNSINGAGAWDANPWVVALTFAVAHHNIDRQVSP